MSQVFLRAAKNGRLGNALGDALNQLNQLAQAGDSTKAVEKFEKIFPSLPKHLKGKPFVWNIVLVSFAKSGDFDGALRWFERTQAAGVRMNRRAFGKMIEAAARAGKPDLAKEWKERLEEADLDDENDPIADSILLYANATGGRVDDAKDILEQKINDGRADLIDFNTLADSYSREANSSKALVFSSSTLVLSFFFLYKFVENCAD